MPGPPSPACVAVVTADESGGATLLRLTGEVDRDARAALGDAIRQISAHGRDVVIDLAGVTFASAALLNFLARLRHTNPDAMIVLRRATASARLVLHAVDVTDLATIEEEPVPPHKPRSPHPGTSALRGPSQAES